MGDTNSYEIAIIGMSGRFPGADNVHGLWDNLAKGADCISRFTLETLREKGVDRDLIEEPAYVCAAPTLTNIEYFDAAFFGVGAQEAEVMDPQHRIFLECSWEAFEDAGYDPSGFRHPVGVFAGARTNTYLLSLIRDTGVLSSAGVFHIGLGNDLAFLTSRVSHLFNLRGPSYSLHTACSTSLVAVHLACQSLLVGECDMALAGGIAVNVPHCVGYLYEHGGVQSPDGRCRTFDAAAGGTVFGSGAGVVVLKRLEDAVRDGDSIHAVIRGSAVNNDGSNKASFTAPSVQGQLRVISEALASAGVGSETISYVECHGTATLLGDAIEARALTRAFGAGEPGTCALGSVKTNLGHLDAAAGITGLIKVVQSMKHRLLPPSLHFKELNPQIDFSGSPFYVNTELSEWPCKNGPLRAGVSAFGVGGTNAHVVIEEAPEPVSTEPGRDWQLLVLSARTEPALSQMRNNLAQHLRQHPDQDLADVAYTLQTGRRRFLWRDSVVCRDREGAIEALGQESSFPVEMEWGSGENVPPVVFLFPGQGSQHATMGRELYLGEGVFREHFDKCAMLLQPELKLDIRKVLLGQSNAEDSDLDQTWLVQPVLFAVEYSLAQLWKSLGVEAKAMLGHSLGEYTAACLAGVMSLQEALRLLAIRGRLMQQAPPGAMLTVSLSSEAVQQFLTNEVTVAAINAPDLCAVAGGIEGIVGLEHRLQVEGIACQRLRTSHAFHCPLVESVTRPFLQELRKASLRAPRIPFISNLTGTWIRAEEACDPNYWMQQLRSPVRFDAAMREILQDQERVLLEVGPGQTLRRLALRQPEINSRRLVLPSLPSGSRASEQQTFLSALGRLWEAGLPVDWAAFHPEKRRKVSLPPYPFERKHYWIDPQVPSSITSNTPHLPLYPSHQKLLNISDWFWTPSWKLSNRRTSPFRDECAKRTWLVFVDSRGIGADLSDALARKGDHVIRVQSGPSFAQLPQDTYIVNPTRTSDHDQLFTVIQKNGSNPTHIAHLWSIDDDDAAPDAVQTASCPRAYEIYGIPCLLQAIASTPENTSRKLWVISNDAVMVESTDVVVPEKAAIIPVCRIAAQESRDSLACGFVDIKLSTQAWRSTLIERLCGELSEISDEGLIAYRSCMRWVQQFEKLTLQPQSSSPRQRGPDTTYVVTGGLGNVGLLLARYLGSLPMRVVLVSKSTLPPQEMWRDYLNSEPEGLLRSKILRLHAMATEGLDIHVLQADVTSHHQMREVIDLCFERFGRVDGIIHAAGITRGPTIFHEIRDLTIESFSVQFRPKLGGLRAISDAIQGKNVPFVLAFSSNASILGGLGFAAYAAANSAMESYVMEKNTKDSNTAWISASWDHWPEETKQLTQYHTSLDKYAMTNEEAFEAFDRIILDPQPGQIIVATGDLMGRLDTWIRSSAEPAGADDEENHSFTPRPAVKTPYVAPQGETERDLAAIWKKFLGIDKVGRHDDFFELGGHSLLATRIIARIRADCGVDVPLAKIFEGPTVAQMAETVTSFAGYANAVSAPQERDREEILRLLREAESSDTVV
jgi:phthiocerol/phenolphthiocerol synthesis type-I polyketide synthase E